MMSACCMVGAMYLVAEECLHMLHNQVDRHLILSATRYNDVSMLHGRRNVVVVRGLHVVLVLLHHPVDVPAPHTDVPFQTTSQSDVGVSLNKDLHVQDVPDLLHVECEDALKDDHVGPVHRNRL